VIIILGDLGFNLKDSFGGENLDNFKQLIKDRNYEEIIKEQSLSTIVMGASYVYGVCNNIDKDESISIAATVLFDLLKRYIMYDNLETDEDVKAHFNSYVKKYLLKNMNNYKKGARNLATTDPQKYNYIFDNNNYVYEEGYEKVLSEYDEEGKEIVELLSGQEFEVYKLMFVEDLKRGNVAEILGVEPDTVSTYRKRIKKKLKKII